MKAADRPLTRQRLMQVMSYDPATGIFTWLVSLSRKPTIGAQAGTVADDGYRIIQIDGWHYKAQRLAWLYHFGRWPDPTADHRDLDRDNNRIANLREATYSQNCMNVGPLPTNTSGFKGVSKSSDGTGWRAAIRTGTGRIHLGYFKEAHHAGAAYRIAAAGIHGDFARSSS